MLGRAQYRELKGSVGKQFKNLCVVYQVGLQIEDNRIKSVWNSIIIDPLNTDDSLMEVRSTFVFNGLCASERGISLSDAYRITPRCVAHFRNNAPTHIFGYL